jgi:leucyl aminopeptidase
LNCRVATGRFAEYAGDALIALLHQGDDHFREPIDGLINRAVKQGRFGAEEGELFQIYPCDGVKAGRLILVGLGRKETADLETVRKAAATVVKTVRNLKNVAFLPVGKPGETIAPLAEGALLGSYRFDRLKSDKKKIDLSEISFFAGASRIDQSVVTRSQVMTEGTIRARDLANLPANLLTPAKLADEARKLGKKHDIPVEVLSESELKKLKMGAMKGDMGAAGAVISLIPILGSLKPRVNVIGIAPLVENMPSGSAYRPGDVLTVSNGKTIEVISTDAEGRLILADALVYAARFKPKYVVDIATLTGACMVALGIHICAGVMGTDQPLVDRLIKAGVQSGERLWQLPLWKEYKDLIKSPVADMKNSGGRWGGAITAGSILSNFAENYRWAHVDMAGMDNEEKQHPYRSKGATGWGVRLLAQFILNEAGLRR